MKRTFSTLVCFIITAILCVSSNAKVFTEKQTLSTADLASFAETCLNVSSSVDADGSVVLTTKNIETQTKTLLPTASALSSRQACAVQRHALICRLFTFLILTTCSHRKRWKHTSAYAVRYIIVTEAYRLHMHIKRLVLEV